MEGFKHEYLDPRHDHSPVGRFERGTEKLEKMGYTTTQIEHFEEMSAEAARALVSEATETIDASWKSRGTDQPMQLPGLSEWLEENEKTT